MMWVVGAICVLLLIWVVWLLCVKTGDSGAVIGGIIELIADILSALV